MSIIRKNPEYKNKYNNPNRFYESDFETFNKMIADVDLMNNYKKWKEGINYKTDRKIKLKGDTHKKLDCFYQYKGGFGRVYIDDMININQEDYLNFSAKDEENPRIPFAIKNLSVNLDGIDMDNLFTKTTSVNENGDEFTTYKLDKEKLKIAISAKIAETTRKTLGELEEKLQSQIINILNANIDKSWMDEEVFSSDIKAIFSKESLNASIEPCTSALRTIFKTFVSPCFMRSIKPSSLVACWRDNFISRCLPCLNKATSLALRSSSTT